MSTDTHTSAENGTGPVPDLEFDFDRYADEMEAEAKGLREQRHEIAAQLDDLDDRLLRLDTAIKALNGTLPREANPKPASNKGLLSETRKAVLDALREHGPELTQQDVAVHAGLAKGTVARALTILASEGAVRQVEKHAGGQPNIWGLV